MHTQRGRSMLARRPTSRRRRSVSVVSDDYLYRCMRGDGEDLRRHTALTRLDRGRDAERFMYVVLRSIAFGSKLVSPFLHTPRDLQIAHKWKRLGRERRNDENYLVRIRRADLPEDLIVDMSTVARQDS